MSYRPNGWEKVNPKPIGTSMTCGHTREDLYKHGEMVADAMLEALKKEAGEFIDIWGIPESENRKGKVVFIPDEKVE